MPSTASPARGRDAGEALLKALLSADKLLFSALRLRFPCREPVLLCFHQQVFFRSIDATIFRVCGTPNCICNMSQIDVEPIWKLIILPAASLVTNPSLLCRYCISKLQYHASIFVATKHKNLPIYPKISPIDAEHLFSN
jgi:hypothetical protein